MGSGLEACVNYSGCTDRQVLPIIRFIKPLFPLHRNTGGLSLSDIGIGRRGLLPAVRLLFNVFTIFFLLLCWGEIVEL